MGSLSGVMCVCMSVCCLSKKAYCLTNLLCLMNLDALLQGLIMAAYGHHGCLWPWVCNSPNEFFRMIISSQLLSVESHKIMNLWSKILHDPTYPKGLRIACYWHLKWSHQYRNLLWGTVYMWSVPISKSKQYVWCFPAILNCMRWCFFKNIFHFYMYM